MSRKTYANAIKDVIAEEMRRDDKVFIMGEDVAEQGGIFVSVRKCLDPIRSPISPSVIYIF
jgi:pyruvate dehydrogenase E1 component beta subunit